MLIKAPFIFTNPHGIEDTPDDFGFDAVETKFQCIEGGGVISSVADFLLLLPEEPDVD